MQDPKCSKGMSKSKTGLRSLGQGSRERVWNREGQAGSGMQSFKNRTKVCGWMGYVVGDLRSSSIMEKCGSEFRWGVTRSVTPTSQQHPIGTDGRIKRQRKGKYDTYIVL